MMRHLIDIVFVASTPTPFVGTVGECFLASAIPTVIITLVVRFAWRRRKGLEDV